MIKTIIGKLGAPTFFILVGLSAGIFGTVKLNKWMQPVIQLAPTPCNCPEVKPSIDFDKVKGFKGTINLQQTYKMEVGGDSLVLVAVKKAVAEELAKLKVAKCK